MGAVQVGKIGLRRSKKSNISNLPFSTEALTEAELVCWGNNCFQLSGKFPGPEIRRRYQRHRLPRQCSGKESICQCRRRKRLGFSLRVGKIPWRRKWQPTPVFLPENSHKQRDLVGYSPRGRKESDTTE